MADIKLPGVGEVPRGGVIAGGIIAIGAGIYLYIKHKDAAAAPAVPAAGYGYGYQAQGYGYGYGTQGFQAGYAAGYGLGIATAGYGTGVAGYGYGYTPTTPTGGGTPVPTTNALWLADAEAALDPTHSPATVSAALGKYLAGGTLTSDQASIVSLAIAAVGDPPVPGANGYPPAVHTSAPGGQPKPGSGTGKEIGKRHTASGTTSLNTWAKNNKTTAGEVVNTTDQNFQDGYMTTANHAKFDVYLNKGTSSKMPAGLVFFSQK
jgi:hypothetical protein